MLKFCENKLRIRANYTSNFLQIHKLILNKEKTELIIFAKSRMKASQEIQTREVENSGIKETNHVNHLGVIIDIYSPWSKK